MSRRRVLAVATSLIALGGISAPAGAAPPGHADKDATWTQVLANAPASEGRWSARAGLQAVTLGRKVFVLGGRVPNEPPPPPIPAIPGDSTLLNDVWSSTDQGTTWKAETTAAGWDPRAYFAAVTKGRYMYVIGGQDFQVRPNPCPPVQSWPRTAHRSSPSPPSSTMCGAVATGARGPG